MIVYRAETATAGLLRPIMSQTEEARSLLREIFTTEADLLPDEKEGTLTVSLQHLANGRLVAQFISRLDKRRKPRMLPSCQFRIVSDEAELSPVPVPLIY